MSTTEQETHDALQALLYQLTTHYTPDHVAKLCWESDRHLLGAIRRFRSDLKAIDDLTKEQRVANHRQGLLCIAAQVADHKNEHRDINIPKDYYVQRIDSLLRAMSDDEVLQKDPAFVRDQWQVCIDEGRGVVVKKEPTRRGTVLMPNRRRYGHV